MGGTGIHSEGGFTFVVEDHERLEETVNEFVGTKQSCHFCGGAPVVILYRGLDDKVTAACAEHEDIVVEMMERAENARAN
jgi:hypothetical protein